MLCAVFHGALFLLCLNVIKELCKLSAKEIPSLNLPLFPTPPSPITQDIYVTAMYSPTNTVSDLCNNAPMGDCSWKLAPQLNSMEAARGATSHIKEGMHHL